MSIRTLNEIFFTVVERGSDRVMLTREGETWQPISSAQLRSWVYSAARQLQAWGVGKGDRVVILSENRPEWAIADYATLLLGAVVVPIYATQTAEQVLYVLQNSEARIAFVSTRQQYEKLASIREQTSLEYVVVMDDAPELSNAIHMHSFLRDGQRDADPELDAIAAAIEPDDLATLIYTSGTTGTPKGVMLTHGNIASNVSVSLDMFEIGKDDLSISYLPLSHITARHVDYALQYHGITIAYCPSIDDLARTMKEVKPTIIVAVPRVYEKVYNQVQHKMHGVKGALFKWALSVGAANREAILRGETPASLSWKLANALVFSKVREGLGGRARDVRLRRRAPGPRDRHLVRRHRHSHPRRLRPHRNLARDRAEQSHLSPPGQRSASRCRMLKSRSPPMAKSWCAARPSSRVIGTCRKRAPARLKTVGSRRATLARLMRTASSPSPIARRT